VYTLPIILALESPVGRELKELLAEGRPGPEDARRVVELVLASGVMREVARAAEAYAEEALARLAPLPPTPAREVLARLARFVLERIPA
jgi:geranylgeranyl pyrophosphate synthase